MTEVVASGDKSIITQDDNGRHYGRGLEGKDAAFLSGNFNAMADMRNVDAVRGDSRANLTAVYATAKDNAVDAERNHARTHELIRQEAAQTRELLRDHESQRLRERINTLELQVRLAAA